jgi:diguanylate cyclase (GGDEF)-like protein/PAS domain S-box-containing protein
MLLPLRSEDESVADAARRLAPFGLCALVAFALLPLSGGVDVRWGEVAISAALTVVLGVTALRWPRVSTERYVDLVALVMLVAIMLLRDGAGGGRGGYGVVVIMPVLWVALYGSRAQLWRVLVLVALAYSLPLAVIGGERYPSTAWRTVPLTVLTSAIVGVVVQELLARERATRVRLQAEHDRSAAILGAMHEGFAVTRDGAIVDVNDALCELTGFTREQLVGARIPFPFWPEELTSQIEDQRLRIRNDDGGVFEATFQRADGTRFEAETTAVPIVDAGDGSAAFLKTIRDITTRKRAERATRERSEQLAALATITREVAYASPGQARETICELALTITSASSATIWEPGEDDWLLSTCSLGELRPSARADADATQEGASRALRTSAAVFLPTTSGAMHFQPILEEGRAIGVLGLAWAIPLAALAETEAQLIALLAHEASLAIVKAAAHAELERLVQTDPLTGLPNRRSFESTHRREIAAAQRNGRPLTLAILDLDHFKAYNDTHGHPAGDALLRTVSDNWTGRLRATDVLARWGGEEFCLLLPGCDVRGACALIDALRPEVPHAQTFSAGVTAWESGMTAEQLIARADEALYAAKRDGRNRTATAATTLASAPPGGPPAPSSAGERGASGAAA